MSGAIRFKEAAWTECGAVAGGMALLLGRCTQCAAGGPIGAAFGPPLAYRPPPGARTDVPAAGRAQGAQDAARAKLPMGVATDAKRRAAALVARKQPEAEAAQACRKLIGGNGRQARHSAARACENAATRASSASNSARSTSIWHISGSGAPSQGVP